MKKDTGKKSVNIIVIILVIIIFCLVGWIVGQKVSERFEAKPNDGNDNVSENASTNNNIEDDNNANQNSNINENEQQNANIGIKVYGQIDYVVRIIGVNENLYKIESNGKELNNSCDNELLSGSLSCSNSSFVATKINVNTNDIYKVDLIDNILASDASYDAFIILNDGNAKLITHREGISDVFKSYKIRDVKESCSKRDEVAKYCTQAAYTLTLQDGTTKTVTSLD